MSDGRGKDEPDPPPLLTSEDLFGDMVDEVDPGSRPVGPQPAGREGPIRVQVAEPGKAPKPSGADVLPEDVAALLDAFADPKEAKPAAARPTGPDPRTEAPAKPVVPPPAAASERERSSPSLDLSGLAERAMVFGEKRPENAPAPVPTTAAPLPRSLSYGPYLLLEKVAMGGMAEVFRAKRRGVEGFEKVVAVKRILSHLSDNKEFVDMFIDEAKMVAGLTHPNIVQIFDLGKIERSYYIAMEYIHGRDLRSIQKRAKERGLHVPLELAVLIVSKVCAALEYAHRKRDEDGRPMRIVHRDISPQNILISYEGEVKLTDFGIAKAATKASSTERGALRGKLMYMSPEQAWGKPMDRRSDIFSLGIVFYETITEQKPFAGSSEMSVLEAVRLGKFAPPSAVNPGVSPAVERAVMKALAREPDDRYKDAAAMGKDLEHILHDGHPRSPRELARFMEALFDPNERGSPSQDEGTTDHGLLQDLDPDTSAYSPSVDSSPLDITKDPMSIEKLLDRFGSK